MSHVTNTSFSIVETKGTSRNDRFWVACNDLTTYSPTDELTHSSTYSVADIVQIFSFLVEDVLLPMTPTTPATTTCNDKLVGRHGDLICAAERFVILCFQWHGLSPIKQSENHSTELSDIIIHRGIDSNTITMNWFNVCILALCGGNVERTSTMIDSFTKRSGDFLPGQDVSSLFCSIKEIHSIIEIECPEIPSAMEMLGTNIMTFLILWLKQSYVGVLSFEDAILFNVIIFEHGYEYAIYLTVAMIRYIQKIIFKHASSCMEQKQSMLVILTRKLGSFRVADNMDYVNKLRCRHPIDLSRASNT